MTKNDDGHVDRAQDRELVGLLEQSALTLEEGYRPGRGQGALAGRAWHSRQEGGGGTHRLRSSLMGLISILRRPMAGAYN